MVELRTFIVQEVQVQSLGTATSILTHIFIALPPPPGKEFQDSTL
jgi:hypothetical protein